MPFIIDGYNLLKSIQKTSEDFMSLTDARLCRILSDYFRQAGQKGRIIFDGIGPPEKAAFGSLPNLEVVFTGRKYDADTIIEEEIAADSAPKRLVVISTDREIRSAAKRRKAVSVKSAEFWDEVIDSLNRGRRKSSEPKAKRMGLSEDETEQWLKLFGLKK